MTTATFDPPETLLLVSCACCERPLTTSRESAASSGIPRVAAWVPWERLPSHLRPWCGACAEIRAYRRERQVI